MLKGAVTSLGMSDDELTLMASGRDGSLVVSMVNADGLREVRASRFYRAFHKDTRVSIRSSIKIRAFL